MPCRVEGVLGNVAREVARQVVPQDRHAWVVVEGRNEDVGHKKGKEGSVCVFLVHPPRDNTVQRVYREQEVPPARHFGWLCGQREKVRQTE